MKTLLSRFIFFILLLFLNNIGFSQHLALQVKTKNKQNESTLKMIHFKTLYQNEPDLLTALKSLSDSLAQKGYLNVNQDSLKIKGKTYTAFLDLGTPLKNLIISYHFNINKDILKKYTIIYKDSIFKLNFKFIKPLLNDLTHDFESRGQSFTQLKLSNITIKNDEAFASLLISDTSKRTISKIIFKGYEDFPKTFVKYYLKLKSGDVFSTSKMIAASDAIKQLNFVSELKSPEVLFTKDATNVYLYLKKTQNNSIDGLIGFTTKANGKGILFNGYLNLELVNAFNSGEQLSLLFKNNGSSQQKFNIGAQLPYIFNSKILAAANLNIYKQDSLYINVSTNLELKYPLNNHSSVGISLNQESSSNLLTNQISNIASYTSTYFGLGYQFTRFNDDAIFNDTFNFEGKVAMGRKKEADVNSNPLKISVKAHYLWILNNTHAIFLKNESALLNSKNILNNELFKIGGIHTIRGFNEERITASSYSIFNLEYRLKTNLGSFLYTITDFGYINNATTAQNSSIYSFGLGYKFKTKNNIINLNYAVGGSKYQHLKLNNSLIQVNVKTTF